MDKTNKSKFIRRTEQEKLDLIVEWEKSGLPIKTFSEEHQFSDSIFHSWLNKYRRNTEAAREHKPFVAVQVKADSLLPEKIGSPYAEILTAKGNQIKLYQPVGVDFLRKLLS